MTKAPIRDTLGPPQLLSLAAVLLIALAIVAPDLAAAQGTDGITSMAENILEWLQGRFAKIVATIALIIVGFMAFTGRASVQLFVTVIIGIFIVFSAGWIVDQITGG